MDGGLDGRIEALIAVGRHAAAADLCLAAGDAARAADLYAAVWQWEEAIATAERASLFDLAYGHALSAGDRAACGRLLSRLEDLPDQARRAAAHAEAKGRGLDAARLLEVAGDPARAAELYEASSEYRDAARCRLALGQAREAGVLLEKRVREDAGDHQSALELARILAQFGRFEPAVRVLQRISTDDPETVRAAARLLVASFAALDMTNAASSRLDAMRATDPELPRSVAEFLEREFGDPRGFRAQGAGGGPDEAALIGGRYRVLSALGEGASGRVVLAQDALHGRRVAIKVLTVGGGPGGRDAFVRFAQEARIAAGMDHPNVVRVHEFNPDGPYLVMEHMSGGTLAQRLAAGRPLPPLDARHVARSVLAALEAVHRRGVVHRDLKPANVFYGAGGEVKLGDFGVAHLSDIGSTLTGAMMGTLAYMAPEQITGSASPDASTDLYAFGVLLFQCLTGRLPFEGPDFVSQHLEQPPPAPSATAAWLTPGFDGLVARLLAKSQSERPRGVVEVLDALHGLEFAAASGDPRRALGSAASEPEVVAVSGAPSTAASSSAAASEGEGERYLPLRELGGGTTLAKDTLLERPVEWIPLEPGLAERLRGFARADHPHLQAVYEVDEPAGRAVLEHPRGVPLRELRRDDPRRARALDEVTDAVRAVHAQGLAHGAIDDTRVLVGAARGCLLLTLQPGGTPEEDVRALAALAAAAL